MTVPTFTALYDACVLYPAPLRDLLMHLALTDLFRARWTEAGAPEGNPADLAPPPRFPDGWQLGPPDYVFRIAEPFAIPADGGDVFRSFVLPLPLDHDQQLAEATCRRFFGRTGTQNRSALRPVLAARDEGFPQHRLGEFGAQR